MEAGPLPGVKVSFVEARVAATVKAMNDVAVAATAGKHGVKGKLDIGREAASLAAGASAALRPNRGRF